MVKYVVLEKTKMQWNLCKKATFETDFSGWWGKVVVL